MLHSTQDETAVRYQSCSWVKVFLLAVLSIEILSFLFLRFGIDIQLGVILAFSIVAVGVFSRQILGLTEIASSVMVKIATGQWQKSIGTFLVAVVLAQVIAVGMLRNGIGIRWTFSVVGGVLAIYFIWPYLCVFVGRISAWIAVKVTLSGRPQFSVRTLLLVVTILAVVSAIVGREVRRAYNELSAAKRLEKLGAEVVYDVKYICESNAITRDDEARTPSLVKRLVGIEGSSVNYVILNLQFLRQGKKNNKIKDDCMVDIASFNNLKVLDMRGTGITDAGLVHLYALTELEFILVSGTQITDNGIRRFKEFNQDCNVYR
ncbi:hypothetical protein [Bythopirellula goksoeyrii]|uniref:Leucine Rich repeats (2 copies) n=1 Tax=Bythopirellula goksoeyrii TaxID=1400387 RepID=A0A5B9Q7G5_9BACT|nr:hypothetical protein [Bythopirellula goksoeyrii]QEG33680.1 Leucine Rich repeats (2 copies) [Bythopirellula goksoeyrii]